MNISKNKRNNRKQICPNNEIIRHGLQNNYAEYFEENEKQNYLRELETIKKKLKSKIIKIKNSVHGFNSKLDIAEKRIRTERTERKQYLQA